MKFPIFYKIEQIEGDAYDCVTLWIERCRPTQREGEKK